MSDLEELRLPETEDWVMGYFQRQRQKKWQKFWARPAPWLYAGIATGLLVALAIVLGVMLS
jgi:hypothetical protein